MKLPKPSAPRASPPALQLQVAVAAAPGTSNPFRLPHLPAHRRAFRSSLRLSPAGAAAGAPARAERARENPASVAHRLATLPGTAPRPQAKPRRPLPPSSWGVLAAPGSAAPGRTHPPGFRAKTPGRGRDRTEKKETFRAGGERARGPSAGLRIPSAQLPRPGPAPSVANRLGPPRRRHRRGSQSRGPRSRIGCGALFLEVPLHSRWGGQSPWLHVSQPLSN